MSIRRAAHDDADMLVRIINAAFQVEKFFIETDRIDLPQVREFLGKGEFLVGDESACVYLEPRGNRCYLGLLSVLPESQGKGLGRLLMEAAEERARELGCAAMDLRIVNLRTELPAFYRRMGYLETGSSDFPADVQTLLPCYFVEMAKALA